MQLRMIILCLAAAAACRADQSTYSSAGQAAPWLAMPTSAQVAAMGGASVAFAGSVNALSVNPAGLGRLGTQQLTLMHDAYIEDTSFEHVAYGYPLSKADGLGASLDYANFGAVPLYAESAAGLSADGTAWPYGLSADLGYGHSIGRVSLGVNVKFIQESLGQGSVNSTEAADLGVLWRQHKFVGLSAGAVVQNLGGQLDGANLPTTYLGGVGYRMEVTKIQRLALAVDAAVPAAEGSAETLSLGAEYGEDSLWALRAGYRYVGNGGLGGLTAGAGLGYGMLQLDYAYVSEGEFGAANQFSLSASF